MTQESRHEVTLEWLKTHATPRGGYTKAQMQALGLAWPPVAGWQRAVVGCTIPEKNARAFEAGAGGAK
jgi:hypothetical protein